MERPGKSEAGVRQMREAGVGQEEAEEWGGGEGGGGREGVEGWPRRRSHSECVRWGGRGGE